MKTHYFLLLAFLTLFQPLLAQETPARSGIPTEREVINASLLERPRHELLIDATPLILLVVPTSEYSPAYASPANIAYGYRMGKWNALAFTNYSLSRNGTDGFKDEGTRTTTSFGAGAGMQRILPISKRLEGRVGMAYQYSRSSYYLKIHYYNGPLGYGNDNSSTAHSGTGLVSLYWNLTPRFFLSTSLLGTMGWRKDTNGQLYSLRPGHDPATTEVPEDKYTDTYWMTFSFRPANFVMVGFRF